MTQLPGFAGELEELIGLEATVALIKERGGATIEVPVRAKGSMLTRIIGHNACELLIEYFGPGRISIPMAGLKGRAARENTLRAAALKMIDAGASNLQIVQELGLSRRTVQNYRKEAGSPPDKDQLSLPLE